MAPVRMVGMVEMISFLFHFNFLPVTLGIE